ncbi:hypothetical protein LXM60_18505 [Pandoraea sputorum]|uniref:hypothetical protein n=1 Tax=Pandoraea sputorum TaxID=93222 RepID=UPI001E4325EF|nr:hypothetical protein [Pandoraea sputorum]MCE4062191.1 hypothetical protein [Pandoraea sputorum]
MNSGESGKIPLSPVIIRCQTLTVPCHLIAMFDNAFPTHGRSNDTRHDLRLQNQAGIVQEQVLLA